MRINNPKYMAGFTPAETDDEKSYSIVTIRQLEKALKDLNYRFESVLIGETPSQPSGAIVQGNSLNGVVSKNGYAWLNVEGKVDPSLIPDLAITNVCVISQNDLPAVTEVSDNTIYTLLNRWLENHPMVKLQRGDIIIVVPRSMDQQDDPVVNPAYSGSYIITDVNETYEFAKLASDDSHIVAINDKMPVASTGKVTVKLSDILKVGNFKKSQTNDRDSDAAELEDVLYRVTKVDEGEDGYRLAFIDDSVQSTTNPVIVKYAKLQELQDMIAAKDAEIAELRGLIAGLRAEVDELKNS